MDYIKNNINIEIIEKKNGPFMLLHLPKDDNINMYKYEIYGDKDFNLFGMMNVNKSTNLVINFKILEDSIFFIKYTTLDISSKPLNTYVKFYKYTKNKYSERNMTMKIIKKNLENSSKIIINNLTDISNYDSSETDSEEQQSENNSSIDSKNENNLENLIDNL